MLADGRTNGETDRQTDRQTDVTKLLVAFRNFGKAPKNHITGIYLAVEIEQKQRNLKM